MQCRIILENSARRGGGHFDFTDEGKERGKG